MFTCRKELEELIGLRHPRKVLIEESLEYPRAAERFFRGIYAEPEKLKKGLADLQRETSLIQEVLGLRKSRFRDWLSELPGAPLEAQEYIKETSAELKARHERAGMAEAKVLTYLQEQDQVQLFPVEEESFGKWSAERILLFPAVIEKIAQLLKLNPDSLNKVILVHFMVHVLINSGEDRDKRTWCRQELGAEGLENLVYYYCNLFYKTFQYKELCQTEKALLKYLPARGWEGRELERYSREIVNGAVIFWRRRADMSLPEVLAHLEDLG